MSLNLGSIGGANTLSMQGLRGMKRPDPEQMADKLFSNLDSSGQGYIQKADLQSAFDKLSAASPSTTSTTSTNVDDLFSKLDSNSDGKVTKQEFSTTLKKLAEQMGDQAMSSQLHGPAQGGMPPGPPPGPPPGGGRGDGGGMSPEQLSSAAEQTGSSELKSLSSNFDKADTNSDGKVSFQEAMAYQQKEASAAFASTSTDSVSGNSSTGASDNRADGKLMSQIMRLMHAYGLASGSDQANSTGSSLSVTV